MGRLRAPLALIVVTLVLRRAPTQPIPLAGLHSYYAILVLGALDILVVTIDLV